MTEPIKIEVGICKTCRHYSETWDDPGAQDCSLSPGKMLIDVICAREDEVVELNGEEFGKDGDNQCPFWEMIGLLYCKKHKEWNDGECGRCMEEAFKED